MRILASCSLISLRGVSSTALLHDYKSGEIVVPFINPAFLIPPRCWYFSSIFRSEISVSSARQNSGNITIPDKSWLDCFFFRLSNICIKPSPALSQQRVMVFLALGGGMDSDVSDMIGMISGNFGSGSRDNLQSISL